MVGSPPNAPRRGTIDAISMDVEKAAMQLAGALTTNRRVERSEKNIMQIKNRIVPLFMQSALTNIWTVDTLRASALLLGEAIEASDQEFVNSLKPDVILMPMHMPHRKSYQLPEGRTIVKRPDGHDKYVRGQFYDGWELNLYNAAAFDSNSAEYKLACNLDVSPDVEWWSRLYPQDNASIGYRVGRDYYPDFVVRDREGRTWIVEGKDASGRTNETVQAKRDAAEVAINLMASNEQMGTLKVGYVIAYEDTIKNAGSWSELLRISAPVVSPN